MKNALIREDISSKEIVYSVSNMVIGFGILTLPNTIVRTTVSADGWIAIILGGGVAVLFAWIIGKLSVTFPGENYHSMVTQIINRKMAHILTLSFALYFLLFVSYQIRGVSTITRLYLFDNTPEEIIGLIFLLVLVYGAVGPSIALVRLNLLFFPIVVFIIMLLLLLNIGSFNVHNLLPVFKSDFVGIIQASKETMFSYLGVEIMLFYNIYVLKKKGVTSSIVRGVIVSILLYLVIFIFVVAVFGAIVAENTLYPLAELAKEVEIPGGIFERFEFFFFVIWLMTLFSTNVMAFDVAVLALTSVFTKISKTTLIIILAPILYIIGLLPSDLMELRIFAGWISYMGIVVAWTIPALLLVIVKMRRVNRHE
ncbi:spore germination protein [Neobacillus mesonae]|nr:spore germination protein [Neobacillus mesonae]